MHPRTLELFMKTKAHCMQLLALHNIIEPGNYPTIMLDIKCTPMS